MSGTMFRLDRNDDHARLTLDRPGARNAIKAAGWAELAEVIGRVEASDVRLLVVTGADGSFCAGADLADFPAMRGDEAAAARFRQEMRGALDRLRGLAIPTLALIDGPCYGAGVALAMACDLRIAALTARFAITPAKLGIGYPQEDVQRLVELVGPGQAARILFSAEPISGEEARAIGLVDDHRPCEIALIEAIVANDRESLKMLKEAIRRATGGARRACDCPCSRPLFCSLPVGPASRPTCRAMAPPPRRRESRTIGSNASRRVRLLSSARAPSTARTARAGAC